MVEELCSKPKIAGSIPDEVTGFFNLPNPSSCTMALGSTQPVTEMSSKNLPWCNGRPAREAGNLSTICVSRLSRKCLHVYNNRRFLWNPCRRFIGDSEGRLQSIIAVNQ
jgi:hypothetical protein